MDALRQLLAQYWGGVIDLLRTWDEDGFGTVDLESFSRALSLLGIKPSIDPAHAKTLFAEFEADEAGNVEIDELETKLRANATLELPDGGDERSRPPLLYDAPSIDPSGDVPEQLQRALSTPAICSRIIEVLREWDTGSTGCFGQRELRLVLPLLGIESVPAEATDAFFDSFDEQHSGSLEYKPWGKRLRKKAVPAAAPAPAAAAAPTASSSGAAKPAASSSRAAPQPKAAGNGAAPPVGFRAPRVLAQRPTLQRGKTAKALEMEAMASLRLAEVSTRHRLVTIKRELQRACSESAVLQAKAAKRNAVLKLKQDIEAKVGLDLNAKIAHVPTATAEEVYALSVQLNQSLAKTVAAGAIPDGRQATGPAWFQIFKVMDDDGSGRISFSELARGVRECLKLTKGELPEEKMHGLWKALDEDASGFISAGEFGRFMRRGEAEGQLDRVRQSRGKLQKRLNAEKEAQKKEQDVRVGRDLNTKLAHVEPASDEEMDALSELLNVRMHAQLTTRNLGWFKFFRVLDDDGSGRISFDELARGIRDKLGVGASELPEPRLHALWRRLDEDASGYICSGELIRFAKRGQGAVPKPEPSHHAKAVGQMRSRVKAVDDEWKKKLLRQAEEQQAQMAREAARLEALLKASQESPQAASATASSKNLLPQIDAHKPVRIVDVAMAQGLAARQHDRFRAAAGALAAHTDARGGRK